MTLEKLDNLVRIKKLKAEPPLESKYDAQFKVVFGAIREMMKPPEPLKKRPIGFAPWKE